MASDLMAYTFSVVAYALEVGLHRVAQVRSHRKAKIGARTPGRVTEQAITAVIAILNPHLLAS